MTISTPQPPMEERVAALEARTASLEGLAEEVSQVSRLLMALRPPESSPVPAPGDGGGGDRAPQPARVVEPDAGLVVLGARVVDHGVPLPMERTPTAWRGRSPRWLRRAWHDLDRWVRWCIAAYCLDGDGWSAWWSSAGAVEELVGLREWHRELVDVEVVDVEPDPAMAADARTSLERTARTARLERGRDWVYWHDALDRVARRVAGSDGRDLLARRRSLATPATAERAEGIGKELEEGFAAFLRELEEGGVVAALEDGGGARHEEVGHG